MNRNPGKGKPFPKGKSGNAKGSSRKSRTRGATRRLLKGLAAKYGETLTPDALAQVISTVLLSKHDELQDVVLDKGVASAQSYAAKLWQYGYDNHDLAIFKAFIEMVVGKPKERTSMELTGRDGNAVEVKTKTELLATALKLRESNDLLGDD